ncbi:hypothetical protein [Olleya sp.]|jgi:Tfp pilus assembly protein PilN|uniref:hypothetical protein n=1 Tax=Olleya sp. TaxID=1906788 RepID=UPI0032D9A137
MLDKIQSYLLFGNRFCGIEHTTNNVHDIIYATVLKQSKKELNLELSFEDKTIEDICSRLPKNQHTILIINNDKVLSKTIESEKQDDLKLVYKAFPNINLKDFYFEILSQKKAHFISLCRKDYVDTLIEDYSKHKIAIIDISLGNNYIGNISTFLNENSVYTSNAEIDIKDNQIIKIQKESVQAKQYDVNGITISNHHLLSFCGAIETALANNITTSNFSKEKDFWLNEYKQTRFFNQFLKIGGLFILGLLLINLFIFNHYFNNVNELEQVSEINQTTKNQIVELNESVSKKQKMVEDLLKSNGSKSSFYSNAVINSLPKTILLSEFNYQPLLKRKKIDKDLELEENRIVISGTSGNSDAFSNWISQLEQKSWIDNIEITDYGISSFYSSDFKIKIVLKR